MDFKLLKGVIEDNEHPDKNGKVKVRIFGVHTKNNENSGESFNFIAHDDLPWLGVMGSLENGLNTGIGLSKIPRKGTMVYVYYFEEYPNGSLVVGTVTGKPTVSGVGAYAGGAGFTDPDEAYPLPDRLNEYDVNRLARVEKLSNTIHQKIIDEKDDQVGITDTITGADVSQTEPDSLNDLSVYPHIQVMETPSGHVIEFDDTPTDPLKPNDPAAQKNERIRIYHRTGSYIEMRPDGSIIQKSVADKDSAGADSINHYIHMSDVNEHIAKSVKTYIEKNIDEIVGGYIKRNIKLDMQEHIEGGVKEDIDMDFFTKIAGYFKIQADGNLEIINDVKITGNLEVTTEITAGSNISSKAEVADMHGNLSSLRDAYDAHYHIGNLGIPTPPPITTDPRARWGDFTWSNTPLGFKG